MPFASGPEALVRQHHAREEPEPGSGSCYPDDSVHGVVFSMPSARRNSTPICILSSRALSTLLWCQREVGTRSGFRHHDHLVRGDVYSMPSARADLTPSGFRCPEGSVRGAVYSLNEIGGNGLQVIYINKFIYFFTCEILFSNTNFCSRWFNIITLVLN